MTTIRLTYDMEEKLDAASRAQNMNKSEFVRDVLAKYFAEDEATAWELGEPYFGNYGSGDGSLSADYKNRLKEKIRGKNRPR